MNKPPQQSGMDIDLGNECSKNAYNWSKKTFANRDEKPGMPYKGLDGAFSNMLNFNGAKIGIASDGIGTKIELAERTKIYHTLGYDLMAMVADDLATSGFVPTNLSNIIDVDLLNYEVIDQLMQGLHDAANFTSVAISGGEIAELGKRIAGYGDGMHFNWCSTAIGILHDSLEQPIDGSVMEAGDVLIALKSRGFRSNGFSLIRRVMQATFGDTWHTEAYSDTQTWGEALLTPSLIFAPAITALLDAGCLLKGIAHITGGGIEDNLKRVLKTKQLGAVLDNLYEPLPVMKALQKLGNIPNEKAYLYWNMGNGMLMAVAENEVEKVLKTLEAKGYEAQVAGRLTAESGVVELKNC